MVSEYDFSILIEVYSVDVEQSSEFSFLGCSINKRNGELLWEIRDPSNRDDIEVLLLLHAKHVVPAGVIFLDIPLKIKNGPFVHVNVVVESREVEQFDTFSFLLLVEIQLNGQVVHHGFYFFLAPATFGFGFVATDCSCVEVV